ncbi:hypothetical protein [Peribacillus sp. NPDC096448]
MPFYLVQISKWNEERVLRADPILGSGNPLPFRRLNAKPQQIKHLAGLI